MSKTMNNILKTIFLLLLSLIVTAYSYADSRKDSVRLIISRVDDSYSSGKITAEIYADSVYNLMQHLLSENNYFRHEELLGILKPLRKMAFAPAANPEQQRKYYGILSNQAQMNARNGEMLYYGEKINQLEQEANNKPSLTALTIIADHYLTEKVWEKVIALYQENKSYLQQIAANGTGNISDLVQAAMVTQKSALALFETGNIAEGQIAEGMIAAMLNQVPKSGAKTALVKSNIVYLQYLTLHTKGLVQKRPDLQLNAFKGMDSLLASDQTPDYLKPYIQSNLSSFKLDYFLAQHQPDSAQKYLNSSEALDADEFQPYNKYLLKEQKARLLFEQGNYRESALLLEEAIKYLDTSRTLLSKDIDEMMYAQVKAEEQQVMLDDAAAENKRKERLIWGLSSGALLLLILGGSILVIIRQRQKRKFLEFKLNMARNLHDETGPALLYAKSLAKSCKVIGDDEPMRAELESHIENTMAVIRSLSHDLKSDKLQSIGSLISETEATLTKLKTLNLYDYEIKEQLQTDRFISHYQFSQLKAVLQECITNSIKHAEFDRIMISFTEVGNKLTIVYEDNGSGWDTGAVKTGIGLSNMKERARQVNGALTIEKHNPSGYEIRIEVPLR